jgi:hypothetical protein
MLDSYVDQAEDREHKDHSYIAHYPSRESAMRAVCEMVNKSVSDARSLRHGPKHAVIASAMTAMYLSKDSAATPTMCASTLGLAAAGGSLTRLMLPILRAWRIAYGQRAA